MNLWYNNVASDNYRHKSNKSERSDHNFLQSMTGKNVKINRGGPESLQGKLLAVKSDYLVLNTNEGVVYIATSHVKSVTESGSSNKSSGNNKSGRRNSEVVNASSFNGVIRAMNQTFVQLNSGGPEKVEGFIAQAGNSSILLVSGKEVMQIQNFHIKSIKAAEGNRTGGNNNKNDNKKNSNINSNENKSGYKNNKTQGNRSGGKRSANTAADKTNRSSVNKG